MGSSGSYAVGNNLIGYGVNPKQGLFMMDVYIPTGANKTVGATFTFNYGNIKSGFEKVGVSFLYGMENAH